MGILRELATERRVYLPPRLLVGRSSQADLRLPGGWVSSEHASIWWDGRAWRVRDLGSRNGTLLEGQQIKGGEGAVLVHGQRLAFGQLEEAWLVDDDAAPVPMAVDRATGSTRLSDDGVLGLPDDDDPRVTVHAEDERWWLQRDGGVPEPVHDRSIAVLDGAVWILRLPEPSRPTDRAAEPPRAADLRLRLGVGLDQETIQADVLHGDERIGLDPRSHHEVLHLLARQQLADAALPAPERGWIDPEVLAGQAGIKRSVLNVYVQRLRKQFQSCGVVGEVIQRRPSHALRLAPMAVEIGPLRPAEPR